MSKEIYVIMSEEESGLFRSPAYFVSSEAEAIAAVDFENKHNKLKTYRYYYEVISNNESFSQLRDMPVYKQYVAEIEIVNGFILCPYYSPYKKILESDVKEPEIIDYRENKDKSIITIVFSMKDGLLPANEMRKFFKDFLRKNTTIYLKDGDMFNF